MTRPMPPGGTTQRGAVLLVGLMLLMPLTLLGLATTTGSTVQHKLSGNLSEATRIEYRALEQLKSAEKWLTGLQSTGRPATCTEACSGTLLIGSAGGFSVAPEHESALWWQSQGHWLVEELHVSEVVLENNMTVNVGFYRLVTRADTEPDAAHVIMESMVAIPWTPPDEDQTFECPSGPEAIPCGRIAWRRVK